MNQLNSCATMLLWMTAGLTQGIGIISFMRRVCEGAINLVGRLAFSISWIGHFLIFNPNLGKIRLPQFWFFPCLCHFFFPSSSDNLPTVPLYGWILWNLPWTQCYVALIQWFLIKICCNLQPIIHINNNFHNIFSLIGTN